jgi:hypothetical protein
VEYNYLPRKYGKSDFLFTDVDKIRCGLGLPKVINLPAKAGFSVLFDNISLTMMRYSEEEDIGMPIKEIDFPVIPQNNSFWFPRFLYM